MKRRQFIIAGAAGWACFLARSSRAQAALEYTLPERLTAPDPASDEGGLWAVMAREERKLRSSPFLLPEAGLSAYLQQLACRLAAAHCPDIRVYLVRAPVFNASMAPNGMLLVATGLLLRVENEAQLAAVVGHELGHYLQRHGLEGWRDVRAKAAFGQFLGLFGLAGAVGALAVVASVHGYSRDQEREADRIGAALMHQAGYDLAQGARVWANLFDELKAGSGQDPAQTSPLFASHPVAPERQQTLAGYAQALPGGSTGSEAYVANTQPFLEAWLEDEVQRRQYAESLVLFARLLARPGAESLILLHRGDVYRLRGEPGDVALALADYRAASQASDPPAQAFRGLGLATRQLGQTSEALAALGRYLELAPNAPDAGLIRSYIEELQ